MLQTTFEAEAGKHKGVHLAGSLDEQPNTSLLAEQGVYHVWDEDKTTLKDFQKGSSADPFSKGHPDTVLINEQGVYQLIFSSKLQGIEARLRITQSYA